MKKYLSLVLLTVVTLTLTACGSRPKDEDPQAVLNKAWVKLVDKESNYHSGVIDFKGKVKFAFAEADVAASGSGTLQFNNQEPDNSQFALAAILDGNGTLGGKKADAAVTGEIRSLKDAFFVKLDKVNLKSDDLQTNLMVSFLSNLYKGKWIALPGNPLSKNLEESLARKTLTGKKYAEIAKKHPMLIAEKDLGSGKYTVRINSDELKAYLQEVNAETENEMSEEDLGKIVVSLDSLPYQLELSVDPNYEIDGVKLGLDVQHPDKDQQFKVNFETTLKKGKSKGTLDIALLGESPGNVSIDFDTTHKEKRVTVDAPEEAEPFDLGALFGGGLGGIPEGENK